MASQVELTPCGAMFDIFKRAAHLSHIELCGLVLSSRPLADGRSPQSRAADRSWVSRFIVRAPVGTLQQRYFAEYGTSAARIMSQLALRQRNPMDSTAVINMVCGPAGEPMVRALEECHQDTNLYCNALDRLSQAAELMPAERAEAVLVLFVAVGCSADVRSSVNYAIDYAHATCGGGTSTPRSLGMSMTAGEREPAPAHPLGLLRVQNSFVVSARAGFSRVSRVLRLARWPLARAILPTSATMSRPAMPISGAMLKISGTSRTCRPPTEPWW